MSLIACIAVAKSMKGNKENSTSTSSYDKNDISEPYNEISWPDTNKMKQLPAQEKSTDLSTAHEKGVSLTEDEQFAILCN